MMILQFVGFFFNCCDFLFPYYVEKHFLDFPRVNSGTDFQPDTWSYKSPGLPVCPDLRISSTSGLMLAKKS
jgi:hypothetical protein